MAFRRGEETDLALLGAMMEVEFEATMTTLTKGWFKAHTKVHTGKK